MDLVGVRNIPFFGTCAGLESQVLQHSAHGTVADEYFFGFEFSNCDNFVVAEVVHAEPDTSKLFINFNTTIVTSSRMRSKKRKHRSFVISPAFIIALMGLAGDLRMDLIFGRWRLIAVNAGS